MLLDCERTHPYSADPLLNVKSDAESICQVAHGAQRTSGTICAVTWRFKKAKNASPIPVAPGPVWRRLSPAVVNFEKNCPHLGGKCRWGSWTAGRTRADLRVVSLAESSYVTGRTKVRAIVEDVIALSRSLEPLVSFTVTYFF